MKLLDFVDNAINDAHLGDVNITLRSLSIRINGMLAIRFDISIPRIWPMNGVLTLDIDDGSVDLSTVDPDSEVRTVLVSQNVTELRAYNVDSRSELIRDLAAYKLRQLEKEAATDG